MDNKKVLVTGASGFLGAYVANELSARGYEVILFDCVQPKRIAYNQTVVLGDINDFSALQAAAQGVAYIYHFAGMADIEEAKDKPLQCAQLNIMGTINVLEVARTLQIKRFIFASSIYVYSRVGSFYRVSKQAAENYIECYAERYHLNYTIVRYGSLYGRRADNRNGIYRLLTQALKEKRIEYHGSPETMREYIHVEDAARLSVEILAENFKNRNIIITGHEKYSIKHVLNLIAEMLPYPIEIAFKPKTHDYHYELTPYAYQPKVGHKLIANDHVDFGQGILDCLHELEDTVSECSV